MRRVLLGSLVVLLVASSVAFAQSSEPTEPSEPDTPALPVRPVAVAVPGDDPQPAEVPLPAPRFLPAPSPPPMPPPPGPPPLYRVRPLFPDSTLDGFATRFWVSGDYLLWWIKDSRTPALVTTGSAHDALPGALGQSGTQVLFGGEVNNPIRFGGRFRAGYWLTPDQTFGLDGSFFFLGGDNVRFGAASDGSPLLARPFLNVNSNRQDAFLVAFPGRQAGSIAASMSSFLWGAEAHARGMLFRGPSYQISLLGGFRFLDLYESLRMRELDTLAPERFHDPIVWTTAADRIHTSNQFYGGQIGTDFLWTRGRFFVDILGKVALGAAVQRASINGWSAFATSDGHSGAVGVGQLAQPSNLGWYCKDQFAVVPEFGLNVGYALTRHLRLTAGYTFLYWSRVFRPGDQIDPVVNTTEFSALVGNGSLHGPARPNFTFKDSDFWAQGLNFGLEFRY